MLRRRVTVVLAVCCVVLTAWMLGVRTGPALGQLKAHKAAKATVVTVIAGKPSELAFKLSKSALPAGRIIFKVTNGGKLTHDFKICTIPARSSAANSCTGKLTQMLKAGKSATLIVTLTKSGRYEFLCTVPGHAGAGMKGMLGVGLKSATPTAPATSTSPSSKPATGSTATCANPRNTTVTVTTFDYGFTLSAQSVPCGTITFAQTNSGIADHNFDISGHHGATIGGGQSTSLTLTLGPGSYAYLCDVSNHEELGMKGTLVVTD